jgi:hypothetical protein
MNCLKEDLNLMLKNMPINVMVPTKISNSIDITSLQMKKPFTGVGKWPAFND